MNLSLSMSTEQVHTSADASLFICLGSINRYRSQDFDLSITLYATLVYSNISIIEQEVKNTAYSFPCLAVMQLSKIIR